MSRMLRWPFRVSLGLAVLLAACSPAGTTPSPISPPTVTVTVAAPAPLPSPFTPASHPPTLTPTPPRPTSAPTPTPPPQEARSILYGDFEIKMIPSSQESDKTDIYVKNLKTGELEVSLTLSDVHISHYHNSEYHNKSLYVIRRIGYDGYPDDEWTDELWRYDTRDKSETKLYSAQGLDFRLTPDEKYVALQHDQKLVFVDALGNLVQEFTLDQLGSHKDTSYPLTPQLNLLKWSDEGNEFWGATNSGPAPRTFYRIEVALWQATVYDISELTIPCEYDLNPNTGKLVYTGLWPFLKEG